MAPIIGTSRDDNLVGTSIASRPTCADDVFGPPGNDRIDGRFVREVLGQLDGQRPFLVHPGAGAPAAEPRHSHRFATHCGRSSRSTTICGWLLPFSRIQ
jgi:hypothetical protein